MRSFFLETVYFFERIRIFLCGVVETFLHIEYRAVCLAENERR